MQTMSRLKRLLEPKGPRAVLFAAILLSGVLLLVWSVGIKECTLVEFLLNAGTELLSIAITIFIVDQLLEIAQRRADVKSLAWDILFDTDYAVWVWQGGERVFNMEELWSLIKQISPADPFPSTTQNIVLALGNKAANMLKTKHEIVDSDQNFSKALQELSNLSRLRDNEVLKPSQEISLIIENTVVLLAEVLDTPFSEDVDVSYEKKSEEKWQLWRHLGESLRPVAFETADFKTINQVDRGVN